MQATADRLLLLLGIFATAGRTGDGRPTSEQLQTLTQLGGTLRPSYRSERSPETIERIGEAAAQLLVSAQVLTGEQAARLTAWLLGAEDDELDRRLDLESRIVKCTGTGGVPCADSSVFGLRPGWFDPSEDGDRWVPALRMCTRHNRASQSPEAAAWEEQVARDLPRAPLPPEGRDKIVGAFTRLRAAYQSIKYRPWALAAGVEERELRRILHRAGLPEKPRAGKKHFNKFVGWPALAFSSAALPWWLLELKLSEPARRFARLIPSLRWPPGAPDWRLGERLRRWLVGPAPTPALRLATVRA